MSSRRPVFVSTLALALGLLGTCASALIVPMTGWVPVGGNTNVWTDTSGACLLSEELSAQAFPALASQKEALAFASKLHIQLSKSVDTVVIQPVDRAGDWGVLAAYNYKKGADTFKVSQLYLGDAGKLRTVTGSSANAEKGNCVNEMREFIRYLAD
ncbi:hypothetical protein [Deinococcus arenicola]|uniref:DUF3558 domain-containing protein n=1 Tax=Deinococcus arenicola TaxID=2994950 RepID=A0ABU4DVL0_9DEIO|nr:hypothetical protein [Deinococcus sp. ZS9-10]MDV6375890.1 hypothetical protein [Deinococcus sp. ZS9-10]